MKLLFTSFIFCLLLSFTSRAQVKIGLPTGPPQASSVLDLSNVGDGTKGMSLPRVATTATIIAPVEGMMVYDISTKSIKGYENGVWLSYSTQAAATPAVTVNCGSSSINGFYSQGTLLTSANTVTIVIANNSFSTVTLIPTIGDIVLSGPGAAGIIVSSATPASASPGSGGGTTNLIYTLSGTPTTLGSFTATFTKLSLSCAKTGAVCLPVSPLTITNTTSPATLPPTIAAGNWIDFTAAGGTNNTGVSWVMSSTPATGMFSSPTTGIGTTARAVLMANASGVVTVVFTATNPCGLLVTQTQTVSAGALYVDCPISAINGIYTQGRALTSPNTITMVVVNNALTTNTVTATIGDIVLTGAAAGMSVTGVSPASFIIPATGGSTTFTYTLSGTPSGVGAFTASYTNGTLTCAKTGTVCLPISPVTVTNTTNPSPLISPIVAGNTITFTAAGGTNNTAITWAMTSTPATGIFTNTATGTGTTAQAILAAGSAGTVTVVFTATNACGLIVTGTQTAAVGDLQVICDSSAVNGIFTQNAAVTPNTITIRIKNNGTSAKTFTPVIGDIVLTGASAGITIASVSAGVNIPANGTSTFTYTLGGTPTAVGSLTATFASGTLNSCVKTSTVCLAISPVTVTNTTSPSPLVSPIVGGSTINFTAAGGTNNTAITWALTSSPATGVLTNPTTTGTGTTAQAVLAAGSAGTVTVVFTATNACGLIVTGTQTAAVGDLQAVCDSSIINGIFTQNRTVTPNTITIRIKNNGTTAKTFTPAIGDILFTGAGAPGITVASVSAGVSIPANGGTSTFTYTLGGTPTAVGSFTATFTSGTLNTCVKTGTVCLDIAPIVVSNTTSPSPLPNPIVATNTITFNATGGTPNTTGISWTITSSPATGVFSNTTTTGTGTTVTANLIAGTTGQVTVTFSATNACGLIVTGTQTVSTGDALRAALSAAGCTSCIAYDGAAANTWVKITASEYTQIDNFVTNSTAPVNETGMNASGGYEAATYTWVNATGYATQVPANNYVIAFSTINYDGAASTSGYVKYSSSGPNNGFNMGGPTLTAGSSTAGTRIYFVMKTPSVVVNTSSNVWVGYYSGSMQVASIGSGTINYGSGDLSAPSGSYGENIKYQVKYSLTKKW